MSENTCASGLLAGRTQSVGVPDWQANSLSALSRSPYISTHETCGVPSGTPTGSGTDFAQLEVSAAARMRTVTGFLRMMRPPSPIILRSHSRFQHSRPDSRDEDRKSVV